MVEVGEPVKTEDAEAKAPEEAPVTEEPAQEKQEMAATGETVADAVVDDVTEQVEQLKVDNAQAETE